MAGCSRRLPARSAAFLLALVLAGCASSPVKGPLPPAPVVESRGLVSYVSGSGPPLVALHGFGGSSYTWHAIRGELSAAHTLHEIDLKGFGKSPKPRDGKYSVYDQSALILDYITRNELRNVTLVGHSFGGAVALATAAELEEKQPGVLSKLVLIDPASYKQDLPWFISILRVPVIGVLSQHLATSRTQVRRVLEHSYFNDKLITNEQVEAYAAPLRADGGTYALRETAKQILPKDIDVLSSRYPHIKVPALIFWGRADKIVPLANGERLSKAVPNATLVIVDRAGHMPHEEAPDAIRKALADFLR